MTKLRIVGKSGPTETAVHMCLHILLKGVDMSECLPKNKKLRSVTIVLFTTLHLRSFRATSPLHRDGSTSRDDVGRKSNYRRGIGPSHHLAPTRFES